MDATVFERFRINLLEQRQNLANWLSSTPDKKKRIRLGPAREKAALAHLEVLETAIEKTEDHTLGQCEVCHDFIEADRLEMDYTCCVCLDHLSAEERNQLEFELELSAKVQQALLPQRVPDIPGLELAAFSRPAQIVGGDYFDFFHFNDGTPGLVVGDVAGHGMSASLLMASLQASLRTLAPDYDSPAEVMRRLNLLFCHNIHLTKFVTLFLARFEPQTRRLTYSNAGHNPPLLFRARANGHEPLTYLNPTGAAIGLIEEFEFDEESVTLAPGDITLLYTDGITEAVNPHQEEFGQDRLADLLQERSDWSAQGLVRAVRQRLQEFTQSQPLTDDTTIVAARATAL